MQNSQCTVESKNAYFGSILLSKANLLEHGSLIHLINQSRLYEVIVQQIHLLQALGS